MKEMQFLVQYSNEEPHYTVTVRKEKRNITALCTCPQGGAGLLCKHRLSLLAGKAKIVIGDNADKIKDLVSWIAWTDVGNAMNKIAEIQKEIKKAEKELADATANLAKQQQELTEARNKLIKVMGD
ncbi:SWIM zinc finger family protein [Candidatus Magnetaquicoccus inordinatus]|uniref:SWIM zinc finger family protein n=1 Tax=Candidatus Magnetaquicoccus inordinatus TaxID=2496818 RepID=UPI00102D1FB9|nr:SWIM zinc finger family protein [Candidatus Magnetaquicoccus inordinatus]